MSNDFVHLHGHTQASLQDAVSVTEEVVDVAIENEQGAIAVTDHGVMSASFDQYQKCIKKGIKPIIGCETYICQDRLDKTGKNTKDNPNRTSHLVLLATDNEGLRNLIKLTSIANTEGFFYKPRIDYDLLYENRGGLIALSACLGGVINRHILNEDIQEAYSKARMMDELMGRDRFFLELQDHGIALQHSSNDILRKIAKETGIPKVVTNDFHYCKHADWEHHCAHVCAGQGNKISDNKYVYDTKQFWIKSSQDMWGLFGKSDPDALENTVNIANQCNVIIETGQYKLPNFPVPPGDNISSYLRKLAWAGMISRGLDGRSNYIQRLSYELDMIDQMGFPGYFLIVQDYIAWARSQGIPVGAGRGCLNPDSPIVLGDGTARRISEVEPGDKVITRDGSLQEVVKRWEYDCDEELVRLYSYYGDAKGIALTKDHKVLAERLVKHPNYEKWAESTKKARGFIVEPTGELEWIPAGDIKEGDWVFTPTPKIKEHEEFIIDLAKYAHGCGVRYDENYIYEEQVNPLTGRIILHTKISRHLLMSPNFYKMLGWFTGDGWTNKNDRRYFGFAFNSEDSDGLAWVRSYFYSLGCKTYVSKHRTKKLNQLQVYSRTIINLLKDLFNEYEQKPQTKHVPLVVLHASVKNVESFIEGLCFSDGSFGDNKITITTISKKLADQVRFLAWRIGVPASMQYDERTDTREEYKNRKIAYMVSIPNSQRYGPKNSSQITHYRKTEDGILTRIRKIELEKSTGKVYDLAVENNHNYMTSSFQVHNSAAGSLVAYVLEITDVDPLPYNLLFERFLNPARVSMPDIDVDFCTEGRGRVVEYVANKYGYDHVARIGTIGTLGVKMAIKDVGRVMDLSFAETNEINKLVPPPRAGIDPTFTEVLSEGSEISKLMKTNYKVEQVITLASKLGPKVKNGKVSHGISKSVSEHAAGVIIARDPLVECVPVRRGKEQIVVTDWTQNECEALGLLKMDFLGLRNLTVMNTALRYIKESTGVEIDMRKIPMDDPNAFKLIANGDVLGLFQLEASAGIAGVCRKIEPKDLEEVGALIALYRPGPMGSGIMDDYIKRKRGEVEWEYFDERIKPFTDTTFGCMIYQEQIMQASVALCGYSLPDADNLRKIIGKKLVEKVEAEKRKLIAGAIANGMNEDKAKTLADMIEKFGEYGFNKSHSIAYGTITVATAWLKSNYPSQYMAALLSSVAGKQSRVYDYIHNCREMGIKVLPPDVNYSGEDFTVVDGTIRFGLGAVKNVATKAIASIIDARSKNGLFRDLNHFCMLVGASNCNSRSLESLILSGCFDSMGVHRAALLKQAPEIISGLKGQGLKDKKQLLGQTIMFKHLVPAVSINIPVPEVEAFDRMQELASEKALIGIYVSGHPLDKYGDSLKAFCSLDLSVFKTEDEVEEDLAPNEDFPLDNDKIKYNDGDTVCVAGIVVQAEKKTSKAGKAYMNAELENIDGSIKLLMFNKTFEDYADLVCKDNLVVIIGKLKIEDGKPSLFINKVKELNNCSIIKANIPSGLDQSRLYGIKSVGSKGMTPIVFSFDDYPDKYVVAGIDSWVEDGQDTMGRLFKLCPEIKFKEIKCAEFK